jgi:dihydroceramidase
MYGPESRGLLAPNVDFMSFTLLVLGIGSFLFHATLRQTLEFVDELSMMFLAWSMLQTVLTVRQPPGRARALVVGLAVVFISFMVFYVWTAKIIYQVIAFLTSVLLISIRSQYLFRWMQPALPADKARSWNWRTIKAISWSSLGYLLWNLEFSFCSELRSIRAQVGLPFAWLFELHGWWHILTAIGAAQFMDVARELREYVKHEKSK